MRDKFEFRAKVCPRTAVDVEISDLIIPKCRTELYFGSLIGEKYDQGRSIDSRAFVTSPLLSIRSWTMPKFIKLRDNRAIEQRLR